MGRQHHRLWPARSQRRQALVLSQLRIDGRERRYTIGEFPVWSVTAARERARELRARGAGMDWDQAVAYTLTQATQALSELRSETQP